MGKEVMPHRAQCPSSIGPTVPTQQRLQLRARSEGGCRSAGLQVCRSAPHQAGGPSLRGHFYSHGILSEDGRLLEIDGIHLKMWS